MRVLREGARRLKRREEGQSLVETSLILACISVVAIGGLTQVGTSMLNTLQTAVDAIASAL